jgi:hypothetical protein
MTYFRMPLLSHGIGPLALAYMAMPLPGHVALRDTPARRRRAVKSSRPKEVAFISRVDQARLDRLLTEQDLLRVQDH